MSAKLDSKQNSLAADLQSRVENESKMNMSVPLAFGYTLRSGQEDGRLHKQDLMNLANLISDTQKRCRGRSGSKMNTKRIM